MTTQTPHSFGTSTPTGDPTLTGAEGGASVRERAGQVGGTAKDEAAGVAQEVKYQARDLVGETRQQVRQQLDTQRGRVSDLLRELGDELDEMADGSSRSGLASDLVRQAAAKTRDARGYLDGGGDLIEDVRRFARRRPGAFLVGAIAAGVLAGRATRAAAAARREDRTAGPPGEYRATYAPEYPGEYTGTAGYGTGTTSYGTGTAGYGSTEYGTGTAGQPTQNPTGPASYPSSAVEFDDRPALATDAPDREEPR